MKLQKNKYQELIEDARDARDGKQSYAPHSNFNVGAAIRTADGSIYTGGNIENDNYTNTIHAEESALITAVKNGHREITHVAIATSATENDDTSYNKPVPCGHCKQSLSQFADETINLVLDHPSEQYICEEIPTEFQLPPQDNTKTKH